jgi:hypothetical protein
MNEPLAKPCGAGACLCVSAPVCVANAIGRRRQGTAPRARLGAWPCRAVRRLFMVGLGLLLLWPAGFVRAAVAQEFTRYQVILDRRPFGEVELASAPQASAPMIPPGPTFTRKLRMCGITERGGQIRVGFVDEGVKPVKPYYLFVGEQEDGFEVVEADYEKETALIRKDGHAEWIRMCEVSFDSGSAKPGVPARTAVSGGRRPSRSGLTSGTPRRLPSRFSGMTRDDYRKARESGVLPAPVPALSRALGGASTDTSKETPTERDSRRRAYNLQLIRRGGKDGPPLPIQLTPTEDAMLVKEGVLE